ncbi:MAG: tRNA pseudouridine(55) synthase TruB [Chloroflexi bacterium]|nr:tRNA pseudouridine(55) synthase TruB [Chloroflexota bacterium]
MSERIDGILNIDKPSGITSMDVVRRIKRASNQKRVGHGGTLDPFASGIVPICLGRATRMMEYLVDGTKEYHATVRLGVETDTYDVDGEVIEERDASEIEIDTIRQAIKPFVGMIEQVPPMFSALKKDGERLYNMARAGIEVEREPRSVHVIGIDVVDWSPPDLIIDVTCGRGFYMRSLAHDLGEVLGCGGHLRELTRTRNSAFHIDQALSLEEAETCFADGTWRDVLHSPDIAVRSMPAIVVDKGVAERVSNGRPLPGALKIPFDRPGEECRVYGGDGEFLALMTFDRSEGQWQPKKVFTT